MGYMKLYKIVIGCVIIVIVIVGCHKKKNSEDMASAIVTKSIEASGGNRINNATITFQFRDRSYKATRNNGSFVLERSFQDSTNVIADRLSNDGFKRYVNGQLQNIQDSIAAKYSSSVNSVHYFSVLPYGLNDDAVNQEYLGQTLLNGNEYYKIKITFDELGGGDDFEDVFIYWIDKESYKVDYLAYSFHVNGGGLRFRKAFNERYIEGIRFVDYENYKPKFEGSKLLELEEMFDQDKLDLLSRIELKNVQVLLNKK